MALDTSFLDAIREEFSRFSRERKAQAAEVFNGLGYQERLLVTNHIFSALKDHMQEGGSYRYLIYERLGFEMDAYVELFDGMELSNKLCGPFAPVDQPTQCQMDEPRL